MKVFHLVSLILAPSLGLFAQNAPVITTQPASQTVIVGETVLFTVAASGQGPFTYEWRFDGVYVPNGVITTVAGNGTNNSLSGDGAAATNASIGFAVCAAPDANGNLFIGDYSRIRKVDTNGIITTVAGTGTSGFSGDGGAATNARLASQFGMVVDHYGNLLICDNNRVRKINGQGVISTVAGKGAIGTFSGNGGPATNATLSGINYVTADGFGRFYFDCPDGRVCKVETNGILTVIGGGGTVAPGDGGPATNAALSIIGGLTVDASGNVFFPMRDLVIRKIDTNGIISTVAGQWGAGGYFGDGGPATNAGLTSAFSVAADANGNLFICDVYTNRIRSVGVDGIIRTAAGSGKKGFSGDGGPAINASFFEPQYVAVDPYGNLFITDTINARIRKVVQSPTLVMSNVIPANAGDYTVIVMSPYGSVTSSIAVLTVHSPPVISQQPQSQFVGVGAAANLSVVATGTGAQGYQWFFNNSAIPGQTNATLELAAVGLGDAGGYEVVITNGYGTITSSVAVLAIDSAPVITAQSANQGVIAGSGASPAVAVSGPGPFSYQWQFNGTNLPNGIISTVAGNGNEAYTGDGGPATNAALYFPSAVAVDPLGNIFISDQGNSRVRKVSTDGIITTVAGGGAAGLTGDGVLATNANIGEVLGVALDSAGNLLIGCYTYLRVIKVGSDGIITTVAGNGTRGFSGDGGAATNASLYGPGATTSDDAGNLYFADGARIRRVGTNGIITTVAGNGILGYSGDGGAATNASLYPRDLAVDGFGNLFIADSQNNYIRKVDTGGFITTVAGKPGNFGPGFSGDGGPATNAVFSGPSGVAVDDMGDLYIADLGNVRVRKVNAQGEITTVVGNGIDGNAGDGGPAIDAELRWAIGVRLDNAGNLFIVENEVDRIRKVVFQGPTLPITNFSANNAGNYDVVVTSPYGSVTSSVVTLTLALPPLRASVNNGTTLTLQATGAAGQTYVLQLATSLNPPSNWQPVFTNNADANGNWSFTNSNLSAGPALFYRLTMP